MHTSRATSCCARAGARGTTSTSTASRRGPSCSGAASLASGLPFLIVRKGAKDYGTANRLEGVFEVGERVCLVEDVVTSAGAAIEAVEALREAGLEVGTAVCVVDREEGGEDALAEKGVRLQALFRASELLNAPKSAAKPHG